MRHSKKSSYQFEKNSKIKRLKKSAFLILKAEQFVRGLWAPFFWVLFFCGLWLFSPYDFFPAFVNVLIALTFWGGFIVLLWQSLENFKPISNDDVINKIEQDSPVPHRPLTSIQDTQINIHAQTSKILWERYQQKIRQHLKQLKVKWLRPALPTLDPYALRGLAFFVFTCGLIIHVGLLYQGNFLKDTSQKIVSGAFPFQVSFANPFERNFTLTFIPPKYTGQLAVTYDNAKSIPPLITLPEGSDIQMTVQGGLFGTPEFKVAGGEWQFKKTGGKTYTLQETKIPPAQDFKIVQGLWSILKRPLVLTKDNPPVLIGMDPPAMLPDGSIRLILNVYDDYGVSNLSVSIAKAPDTSEDRYPKFGAPVEKERSVISAPAKETTLRPVFDFSGHEWAGLPISMTVRIEDDTGQTVSSDPLIIQLPEKVFKHQIASIIASIRKKLIFTPQNSYDEALNTLYGLSLSPNKYRYDPVAYLALYSAFVRMALYAPMPDEKKQEIMPEMIRLLWDIAIKIENGNLGLAARELQDAQDALLELLNKETPNDAEIAEAMQNMYEALASYFNELSREIQKMAESGQPMMFPEGMNNMNLDPAALQDFLSQMENLIREGKINEAREMLSQLQNMTDILSPSVAAPLPEDVQQMSEMMEEIQDIIRSQEALLGLTEKAAEQWDLFEIFGTLSNREKLFLSMDDLIMLQDKTNQEKLETEIEKYRQEQDSIRARLGDVMVFADQQNGKIPENLTRAGAAMREAVQSLETRDMSKAVTAEKEALDALKEQQDDLQQQISQRLQQLTGFSLGGSMRRDPFGRPLPNGNEGNGLNPFSTINIPEGHQDKPVDEILKILRERAGERSRPQEQREYFERLLHRF